MATLNLTSSAEMIESIALFVGGLRVYSLKIAISRLFFFLTLSVKQYCRHFSLSKVILVFWLNS